MLDFTVGIIGVGNMGLGMLRNLQRRGVAVTAFDVLRERCALAREAGAEIAKSAQHLQACHCVIICVIDAPQTIAVVNSLTLSSDRKTRALRCVLLCPTIAPNDVQHCAQLLATCGVDCIDAPMSGGPVRAEDGSMSLMVACADAVFEAHAPLLNALSSQVFRISTQLGDAAKTKLVNNLLAAINLAGAAECMALASKLGLNLPVTLAVIAQSSGASWIGQDRLPRALVGDYAPRAHTALLAKDSALALEMAAELGFDARLGRVGAAAFAEALAQGLGAQDDASLFTLMQQRTL